MRYRDKGKRRSFYGPTSQQRRQFACDYQRHSGNVDPRHRRDVRFSKARLEVDQESIVHLRTANGIVDGKRGRAQTIQLRSLVAKDVPIVVHAGGAYGDGIDGLLGMSFLSRFNINMDGKTVRISPRTAR
jgi:gag-polyprotein putative aspartyl protease